MNKHEAFSYYASQLEGIRESGVLKAERIITIADGKVVRDSKQNRTPARIEDQRSEKRVRRAERP